MKLYEHIDLANKFSGKPGSIVEAVQAQQAQQPDKTVVALDVARHLTKAKPEEAKPVQLGAMPVPN